MPEGASVALRLGRVRKGRPILAALIQKCSGTEFLDDYYFNRLLRIAHVHFPTDKWRAQRSKMTRLYIEKEISKARLVHRPQRA